ncbi:MAG: NAD(P) transhydrogenase subunit alpha [Gemmatimonadota bacterium]
MTATGIIQIYVFILAGFVGFLLISKVPPLLHTPLMAATNAISGISLVGSIVLAGGQYGRVATILGVVAVACAMTNVVGGFIITDRMLNMFKRGDSKTGDKGEKGKDGASGTTSGGAA